MTDYSPICHVDWLDVFKCNYRDAMHFKVDGDELSEELWLLCDPDYDPSEAADVEELKLLLFHPRQPRPKNSHFKARITEGMLELRGRLYGNKVILRFRPSKRNDHTFYATLGYFKIGFDITRPRRDFFFYSIDSYLKKGDNVLYNDDLWTFVRWHSSTQLLIERIEDGEKKVKYPSINSCLWSDLEWRLHNQEPIIRLTHTNPILQMMTLAVKLTSNYLLFHYLPIPQHSNGNGPL